MANITHAFAPKTQQRIGSFLLILGVVLLVTAVWRLYIEATFIDLAIRTLGTVIAVSSNARIPTVEFASGSDSFRFVPVSSDSFHHYAVGDSVSVLYLSSNPDVAKLNQFLHLWSTSAAFLLGAVFAIIFGWLTVTDRGSWGPLKQVRVRIGL